MRHRAQQRGLHEVAAPQRLGLERIALEAVAVDGDGEERRERRQEAVLDGGVRVGAFRRVEGADHSPVDLERERRGASRRPVRFAELDLGARDAEHQRGAGRDLTDLFVEPAAAQQLRRELCEQRRLALALLRRGRAPPGAGGELADDDRGGEVHGEREPVRAVRQRERVHRRQVEPVEGEHARDRDDEREAEPVDDGDRQHGEHVEDAEAQHRDVRLEELDHRRDDRDGDRAGEESDREPLHATDGT